MRGMNEKDAMEEDEMESCNKYPVYLPYRLVLAFTTAIPCGMWHVASGSGKCVCVCVCCSTLDSHIPRTARLS